MYRKWLALGILFLILSFPAQAQQRKGIVRIGYLTANTAAVLSKRIDVFRQGLRELGYVEGKDIDIEYRYGEGKSERLPQLASELVHLKVDVIVSGGSMVTRAAKAATVTIPIVMAADSDPVGDGFVASLARAGGNVAGLVILAPALGGKRLELLKEIVPRLSRVVVLGSSAEPSNAQLLREVERAAGAFRVQLQYQDVIAAKDIETAFQAATTRRADAVLLLQNSVTSFRRTQVVALATKGRLPTIYFQSEFVEQGGLLSYGPSIIDLHRRAATYVDKILRGANPADLPVERPTRFELMINLKTAKQIGLTIPRSVLARADKVIK